MTLTLADFQCKRIFLKLINLFERGSCHEIDWQYQIIAASCLFVFDEFDELAPTGFARKI